MARKTLLMGVVIGLVLSAAGIVVAGSLNPTVGPTGSGSQMFTLQQIYDLLNSGAQTAPMTTFTEPSSGPTAGTMQTLTDIWGKAPKADNTNGANANNVMAGKTFWGLRTDGTWGTTTGTLANATGCTVTPGTGNLNVPSSCITSGAVVVGDTDLVAGNIRCGKDMFGVTGTLPPSCVPETGQFLCFSYTMLPTCPGQTTPIPTVYCWTTVQCGSGNAGQDGRLQKGCEPHMAPTIGDNYGGWDRSSIPCTAGFLDNLNGTVTDLKTGLIWLKNADCFQPPSQTYHYDWLEALAQANTLNSGECGLTDGSVEGDWRLPNQNEIRSLLDHTLAEPYVPSGVFTGLTRHGGFGSDPMENARFYWTSTTDYQFGYGDHPDQAYVVQVLGGKVTTWISKTPETTFDIHVWPVRGGDN